MRVAHASGDLTFESEARVIGKDPPPSLDHSLEPRSPKVQLSKKEVLLKPSSRMVYKFTIHLQLPTSPSHESRSTADTTHCHHQPTSSPAQESAVGRHGHDPSRLGSF